MHNVLLLYREFPDAFWSFKHSLEFINKKASSPPLGILTVEAMLPCSGLKSLFICNVSASPMKTLPGLIISSAGTLRHEVAFNHRSLTFYEVNYGNKESVR